MTHVDTRTSTVAELLLCLGGPLIWATHLFVLYGASTLACLNTTARHSASFYAFALAFTLMAILAVLALMAWQAARARIRDTPRDQADGGRFLRAISIVLGSAGLLAIVWGTLPVLMLPSCSGATV